MNQAKRETLNEIRMALHKLGLFVNCEIQEGDPGDRLLASCGFTANGKMIITLDPSLAGRQFVRVLLHEFGHALGLGHTKNGIMASRGSRLDCDTRDATPRQKKKWVRELFSAVMEDRAKNWKICGDD